MKHFFEEINQNFVDEFNVTANKAKSIVLASHTSPDDDSISSLLGVYFHLINHLGLEVPKVKMLYTGDPTNKWQYFENFEKINFVPDIADHLDSVDLLIFTDGSGWKRFSRREDIAKFKGKVICIDHHHTPEDKFDLHLVARACTSTAEIVYKLFYENAKLTKRICETLLLGILGDTGNFRFVKSVNADVFGVAARLVSEGDIDIQTMQSQYQQLGQNVYKTLMELMSNSKINEIDGWPRFITSYVAMDFVNKNKISENEVSEGSAMFTPYLTNIKDVTWGFVFTPKVDKTGRLSLRSLPNSVSVRIMMEKTKFGGGHDRAAGGKVFTNDHKKAIKQLVDWMKKNKPVLI